MDIQLEYFEEDKDNEKNIHQHTDSPGYDSMAKTYSKGLCP